jgi:N-methylhydantoinase A
VKGSDVERHRLGVPMVDVRAIGAGGGSIACVDAGLLRVGPESAGSAPGPACYGRGGVNPTVSDADLVLGYLSPQGLLGGSFPLDKASARRAIEREIAIPLGMSVVEASLAIFTLVNHTMVNAIREASVERGYDLREFALVVAGGCGPIHGASLAQELGISHIIVPRIASTFCAFGSIVADNRHDFSVAFPFRTKRADPRELEHLLREMEERGGSELEREGVAINDRVASWSLDMRYLDQAHECVVEISKGPLDMGSLETFENLFHETHEALYTYCDRDQQTEIVNARVTVRGRAPALRISPIQESNGTAGSSHSMRSVLFEGWKDYELCPVYPGHSLKQGKTIDGPAVIEEPHTTVLVPRGATLTTEKPGIYVLSVRRTEDGVVGLSQLRRAEGLGGEAHSKIAR